MVVVLPAPLGPSKAKIEEVGTERLKPFTAMSDPKRRVNSWISTAGGVETELDVALPDMCADSIVATEKSSQSFYSFRTHHTGAGAFGWALISCRQTSFVLASVIRAAKQLTD
jgi:hypothetical protein